MEKRAHSPIGANCDLEGMLTASIIRCQPKVETRMLQKSMEPEARNAAISISGSRKLFKNLPIKALYSSV